MNKQPTRGNGKICYLEIPALNIKQSANFYHRVFEWSIREDGSGNIGFDDSVGEVSGMWTLDRKPSTETGVGIMISIMVDSVAKTLELIQSNGGKVVWAPEENSKEVIALFSDPAGNVMCLYQSNH